jgi:hypothetical protein
MCGFAVLLAIVLAGAVLPNAHANEVVQKELAGEHNKAVGV